MALTPAQFNLFRRYARIFPLDMKDVARIQTSLGDCVDELQQLLQFFTPLNGRLVRDVSFFANTDTTIEHQLGREWRGAFAVRVEAPPPIAIRANVSASTGITNAAGVVTLPLVQSYNPLNLLATNTITIPRACNLTIKTHTALFSAVSSVAQFTSYVRLNATSIYACMAFVPQTSDDVDSVYAIDLRVPCVAGSALTFVATNSDAVITRTVFGSVPFSNIEIFEDHAQPEPYIVTTTTSTPPLNQYVQMRAERACTADIWVW